MTFSEKNVCKNCGQPNAVPELEQKNNEIGLKLMKMVWDVGMDMDQQLNRFNR